MLEAILMIAIIYLSPVVALIGFAYGMERWLDRAMRRDAAMSDPYGKVNP